MPRLPFSFTVRPNSDIVTTTTSAMRSPMSLPNAAMPRRSRRAVRDLPRRAAFVRVVVPLAQFGEGDFEDERDDLRDLAHRIAEARARILRAVGRRIAARVRFLQHADGIERFAARGTEERVGGLRVLRRKGVCHVVGLLARADAELAELADRQRRGAALQRTRQRLRERRQRRVTTAP